MAVSGAPVTDYMWYDTGYTERYLGVPPSSIMVITRTPLEHKSSELFIRRLIWRALLFYWRQDFQTSKQNCHHWNLPHYFVLSPPLSLRPGRLLIIHGMNDENVFFTHTSMLLDALIQAGKPYQIQIYNGERHGIRNPTKSLHCDAAVLQFLLCNLWCGPLGYSGK